MRLTTYADPGDFLAAAQAALESREAANNLMLGVCLRLVHQPERIHTPPLLVTVHDAGGLALAAMMTSPYELVLYHHQGDPGPPLDALAQELVASVWSVPGVLAPDGLAEAFARRWAGLTACTVRPARQQRVFRLTKMPPPPAIAGRLRPATAGDLTLVTNWWEAFNLEALGETSDESLREAARLRIADGDIFLWEVEPARPVSMMARTRPTRHGIGVSLVYTPPALRRLGYASAGVTALSRRLLAEGRRFCCLFTDLANPTSNHIYQVIGYRPVADFNEFRFAD